MLKAIKNFTEAGITIINIKKLFFKIIPIIVTLAIVFTVCNYIAPFFLIIFILFVIAIISILQLIF